MREDEDGNRTVQVSTRWSPSSCGRSSGVPVLSGAAFQTASPPSSHPPSARTEGSRLERRRRLRYRHCPDRPDCRSEAAKARLDALQKAAAEIETARAQLEAARIANERAFAEANLDRRRRKRKSMRKRPL
jgi:CHAT domain-containing protein